MIPKQSAGVRPASDEKGLVPSCWAPVAVQLRLGAVGRTEEPAYAVGKGGREDADVRRGAGRLQVLAWPATRPGASAPVT